MSYILDALKESEKARGSRKTRALLAEPVEVILIPSSQPRKSLPRWPYIAVLILLLNAGIFAFWLRPWQWGGVHGSGSGISGGQFSETSRQEAPVIPPAPMTQMEVKQEATEMKPDEGQNPAPMTQMEVKQEATESQPGEKQNPAPNPPASDVVTAVSAVPPVSGTQTHGTVQDRTVENVVPPEDREAMQSLKTEPVRADQAPAQPPPTTPDVSRKDEVAAKKPDARRLLQNPRAAEAKKNLKTAKPEAALKNQTARVEQPQRPAAASEIISDMKPIAELGASSGKPAAVQEPKWHELSPQVRDALPSLSFSMLVYAKKPEGRWININGSKRREGEEITAGLKLEEITPDGAIFSYQGHRFYKAVVGD
ncbi:MAG: general secretion pathway protein GspB [Syntrophobacteraceae bacterium]|jgi:hypothetical protein